MTSDAVPAELPKLAISCTSASACMAAGRYTTARGAITPLTEQLADGGRLLIPLGGKDEQDLVMFTRRGPELVRESILPVRFVPLLGTYGWREDA